jgi:hypothetical protein
MVYEVEVLIGFIGTVGVVVLTVEVEVTTYISAEAGVEELIGVDTVPPLEEKSSPGCSTLNDPDRR